MGVTARLEMGQGDRTAAVRGFLRRLLDSQAVGAVLVAQPLPRKRLRMPTLVTDPERLEGADPFSPCFAVNGARLAARLSRKPMGVRWAAVMRPCEVRAFIEMVKLKQAGTDEAVLISFDCPGAYPTREFLRTGGAETAGDTERFLRQAFSGEAPDPGLSPACRACEHPVPPFTDVHIGLLGGEAGTFLQIEGRTAAGEALIAAAALPPAEPLPSREAALGALIARRAAARDELFARTEAAVATIEGAAAYFADCLLCTNCRVACPVCTCRECVFATDVFEHDPFHVLRLAERGGLLKLPSDTLFFHLTRLAHMSTACVGCGQCSNACPQGIAVMEVFRTVARRTQQAFGYEAGRSLEDPPPLAVFREEEFTEAVGIPAAPAGGGGPGRTPGSEGGRG